jgi:DNA-binding NtrC family response regulator
VRELENTIERAVVLTMGSTIRLDAITIDATVAPARTELPSFRLRDNVEWIECETIRQALQVPRYHIVANRYRDSVDMRRADQSPRCHPESRQRQRYL